MARYDELAPEVGEGNPSIALVGRLSVGLALRKIELLLGRVHVNPVIGFLAEINFAMSYREIFLSDDWDVMRPKNGITPAVDFIYRDRNDAVAVGILEGQIDPDFGRFGVVA